MPVPVVSLLDIPGAMPDGVVSGGILTGTDNLPFIQQAFDTGYDVCVPATAGIFGKNGTPVMRTKSQRLFGQGEDSKLGELALTWQPPGFSGPIASHGVAVQHNIAGAVIEKLMFMGCATGENTLYSPQTAIHLNTDGFGYKAGTPQSGRATIRNVKISGVGAGCGFNIAVNNHESDRLRVRDIDVDSIVGVDSGWGYGVLSTGDLPDIEGCNFYALPGQGRHPIYLSNLTGGRVHKNYMYGYKSCGIPINTSYTNRNGAISITGNTVDSCCLNSIWAGDAAIGLYFQDGAASFGGDTIVSGNIIRNCGKSALWAAGVNRPMFASNRIYNFAMADPVAHGVVLNQCYDGIVSGNGILNGYASPNLVFVEIISSAYTNANGNTIRNTTVDSSGNPVFARAAFRNNGGNPLTSESHIFGNPIFGAFTYQCENPTQSLSTFVAG